MAPSLILIMLFGRCFRGRAQAGGYSYGAHAHTRRGVGSCKRQPLAVIAAQPNGDAQKPDKRARV